MEQLYWTISVPSLCFFVGTKAASRISHIRGIKDIWMSQSLGLVRHRRIGLVRYSGVPARKESFSIKDSFSTKTGSIRVFFASVLFAASSDVIDWVSPLVSASGMVFENLCLSLRDYLLALYLA